MLYRPYRSEDFGGLYAIEEICFEPPQRFTRRYMRQLIDEPGTSTSTWMAEEGGVLAGFAIVNWAQDHAGIVAYIPTIEVLPEWRGKGIGAELLRRLEGSAVAQKAVAIWLHVDAANERAIRLYERGGYETRGRADHYYARNRAAVIYAKDFKP
jgi:[ribosomal protein S18]-alanine N-acetyltransferase